ncbi:sensor histidine kinase [Streptomyces telluris]|uniref:histidine kinase n=1 Tax=Streptomyces telluris TaxID=2720021 RepID=A0A9X2LES8_9ACTN|nr:sensor histidine kinase [Streptomyces telluris]MCQ8769984.1 sensor histidine kinase [Streptomyces telluris]NJP77353.1 sensor histidine kinase [Streptomyces telluris]
MRLLVLARPLLRPFDGVGRSVACLAAGVLVQLAALLVVALPWLPGGPDEVLSVLAAVAVPLALLAAAAPVLSAVQRARFRNRLGVEIAAPAPPGGLMRRLRSESTWRQVRYHLVVAPLLSLGGAVTLLLWAAAGVAATVYVWIWVLPPGVRLANTGYTTQAAYVTVAGIAGLYTAAWLSGVLARTDARAAARRLGPSRAEVLEQRVEEVAASRAGVVDAADAERRRIERDLHDGAQQRLVSMAVNLGLAKVTLKDLPDEARQVIDEAHREAKEAIAELGNLVRGLHPAVLEDRGLDAALSGIAERTPLPVGLTVDLADRPAPTVEAVAYFVVSEALANVVKHARATRADVRVERRGGILLVVVTDDGVGGADPTGGSGLAGLAKRVASVDGKFSISSPVGGPTVVTVELPCAP